jgi:hypothetical protein
MANRVMTTIGASRRNRYDRKLRTLRANYAAYVRARTELLELALEDFGTNPYKDNMLSADIHGIGAKMSARRLLKKLGATEIE